VSLPEVVLVERVVPVARGLDADSAPLLVEALRDGGITSIEITVEGSGGIDAIAAAAREGSVVGAGTITTVSQAAAAVGAGARFLVTPHVDVGIIDWARERGVPIVPGALTPTEIATARRHGAAAVKIFPAHVFGPDYLRSLRGPYPDLRAVPTGGIEAGNAAEYLAAGAVAVGVGSWLTGLPDLAEVTRRAQLLREAVA
jgi:2-dehydro-3-deoxyphosphogluconate aldolase/(4S)-4-hydroxy-2-oxoglutarate aldolase